jgi:lactate dehydrogenase-like 2-hydroxyacid dehydrogenase
MIKRVNHVLMSMILYMTMRFFLLCIFLIVSSAYRSRLSFFSRNKWHQRHCIENVETETSIGNNEKKSAFIFGLGYVGKALAKSLQADGWKVSGTCRSVKKVEELRNQGLIIAPIRSSEPFLDHFVKGFKHSSLMRYQAPCLALEV